MPVTPFHFGPGLLVHAMAPRQVSLLAFCGVNVVMDCEPLYYMVTGQYPLHRLVHSYIGASLAILLSVGILHWLSSLARRYQLAKPLDWQHTRMTAIWLGAAAGGYSHIVLDSIMHADMVPLAPFSRHNALYQAVSLVTLHQCCLLAGLAGAAILVFRTWMNRKKRS